MSGPSTSGPDGGRDERGRFRRGNRIGRGNPLAGKVSRLRAALIEAVTVGDVRAIARALVKRAKAGEIEAVRVLLAYSLGKPLEIDIIERIETLESELGPAGG